ncbi:Rz-like lysis system protein LysB [Acerihabitans sp. TG2]|uniref:Rz-like lysis system protein LysB n=1 Tax=Acerihabitans sp. TG2 TaxID=3096008 RepID=UPI002B233A4D|nr:Rz-like lysis system protein LysB [Acerihabitans sp. TG2]MEA9389557.1 Rz-like lysis system protein LysB [Acerihabitans sp. TG2]
MRLMMVLLLAAAVAIAGLLWYTATLNDNLEQQTRINGTLSVGIESRDTAIARLQHEALDLAKAELSLRQSLTAAGRLAQNREQRIQGLLNENQTLRDWYDTALPDAAVRLHLRPTFASAADYLRWLSESEPLPDAGQSAEN